MDKPVLSGLGLADLTTTLALPAFRARQIFKWLSRGVSSFDEMTDLSLQLRSELSERFELYTSSLSDRLEDTDGTIKLQLRLKDGATIEAVLLSDGEGRRTACLSTQVGCPMGCTFCRTGSLGYLRNLGAAEIVEQFLYLKRIAPEIGNIVVMGMGEPLLNLDALKTAVGVFCDEAGLGLSRRRITVSTSGIVSGIRSLAEGGPEVRLAVSLTTADSELRSVLMPVTKSNPLPDLKKALLYHRQLVSARITLEAVLLRGLNTRARDADAMAEFAQGLDTVVNLIPWNPVDGLDDIPGAPLKEPSYPEVERFARELERRGLQVTRRFRKGRGISGACGQLGSMDDIHGCQARPSPRV